LTSAFLLSGLIAGEIRAGSVTYSTVPGSDSDGPLAATVVFTPIAGGIDIIVTNTESSSMANPLAKGQAVSALYFSVSGGLNAPTAFYLLTGDRVNSAGSSGFGPNHPFPANAIVTPFSDTPLAATPHAIDHWGFARSGSSVTLATAGSSVKGATGSPHDMILPAFGQSGPGHSLSDSHFDPYLLGATHFFLADPGVTSGTNLTSGNFINVGVGFGTGPDRILTALDAVPEPSTLVMGLIGLMGVVAIARRNRRLAC
jgi:hypothetical protein